MIPVAIVTIRFSEVKVGLNNRQVHRLPWKSDRATPHPTQYGYGHGRMGGWVPLGLETIDAFDVAKLLYAHLQITTTQPTGMQKPTEAKIVKRILRCLEWT